MCRNDRQLTCWNQTCNIPIRFETPVCQINEIRLILAESQHNFYFLPHINSKTTEPIFTIFLHDVVQLDELLMRISQGDGAFRFRTWDQRLKTVNFEVCKNRPKLIGYHSNILWTRQNLRQFYNPYTCLYQSWNVGEDCFSISWDIRWIGQLLRYHLECTNFSHLNFWRYWTKVHHIYTRCREIICTICLLIHIAIFNSILKCQATEWRSLCKFCLKSDAMATSLNK